MSKIKVLIKPRFYETDALGHINNSVVSAWFEIARTDCLRDLHEGDDKAAESWVLATITIDFVAETFYGADVELEISEMNIGNSSIRHVYTMTQQGEVKARGHTVIVHFDVQAKQAIRVPDKVRARAAALGY